MIQIFDLIHVAISIWIIVIFINIVFLNYIMVNSQSYSISKVVNLFDYCILNQMINYCIEVHSFSLILVRFLSDAFKLFHLVCSLFMYCPIRINSKQICLICSYGSIILPLLKFSMYMIMLCIFPNYFSPKCIS
jgi:hypothetical protein